MRQTMLERRLEGLGGTPAARPQKPQQKAETHSMLWYLVKGLTAKEMWEINIFHFSCAALAALLWAAVIAGVVTAFVLLFTIAHSFDASGLELVKSVGGVAAVLVGLWIFDSTRAQLVAEEKKRNRYTNRPVRRAI